MRQETSEWEEASVICMLSPTLPFDGGFLEQLSWALVFGE